jgi:hypothetical protein
MQGDVLFGGAMFPARSPATSSDSFKCTDNEFSALRWSQSNAKFEACQRSSTWSPIKFCDRNCGFLPPTLLAMPANKLRQSCNATEDNGWDQAVWFDSSNPIFSSDSDRVNVTQLYTKNSSMFGKMNISTLSKSCFALNYSSPSFLHLKAYYNVSGWLNASLPAEEKFVNKSGASRNCYSKLVVLSSIKGLVSDGPGNIGNFNRTFFYGADVTLLVLRYTPTASPPAPAPPPSGIGIGTTPVPKVHLGTVDFTVYANVGDLAIADWKIGSDIKIRINPAGLAAQDPILSLDGLSVTLTSWNKKDGRGTVQFPSEVKAFECRSCMSTATVNLVKPAFCMSDDGGCFEGDYSGTTCAWFIQPPAGYGVKLSLTSIKLSPGDRIFVDVSSAANSSLLSTSFVDSKWVSNSVSGAAQLVNTSRVIYSDFGQPMLVVISTVNASRGVMGFEASYEMRPRVQVMKENGNATNLQFALAILELQGSNISGLQLFSGESSLNSLFSSGNGRLGPLSSAEYCFLCSWDFGTGQPPGGNSASQLPIFSVRPSPSLLGLDSNYDFNVPTSVNAKDIPAAVVAMGYNPAHFIRTGHVSRFPPGSFKAPTGKFLGPIPLWGVQGDTDPSIPNDKQPTRDEIGWGLEVEVAGLGDSWFSETPYGWGWDDGYSDQKIGKQWRDTDGANDATWPDWQILKPSGKDSDFPRLRYDLDHSSVPLFSFVDSERRIVLANQLALSAPCGVSINNTCEMKCGDVVGTGLNLQQCMAKASQTPCNAPVVDACNNDCGIVGTLNCRSYATAFSALRVHTLSDSTTASFSFTVGKEGNEVDNALYLSFQDSTVAGVNLSILNKLKSESPFSLNYSTSIPCNLECFSSFFNRPGSVLDLMLSKNFFAFINDTTQTSYPEIGSRSWPSCSNYSLSQTSTQFMCRMPSRGILDPATLFRMYDWNTNNRLDSDEFLALTADLQARRQALLNELWARTEKYKWNLMKVSHLEHANSSSGRIIGAGVEFGSPDCNGSLECFMYNKSNTLRVSTNSLFAGNYLQIGSKQDINISICPSNASEPCEAHNPSSYIFVDGIIEEQCPFVMNANSSMGYNSRICVGQRNAIGTLLLPDANGIFITSGNTEDVHSLVGLRGNRSIYM